jgi:3-deoxy-D-manno-octulosonic-acid transferase
MPTSPLWVVVSEILVHNLLEPVLLGPNHYWSKLFSFAEATALVNMGGCISVSNKTELIAAFKDLMLIPTIEAKRSYL